MKIELFYIGDKYYFESGTRMSSIYRVDKVRTDWGFVQILLDRGNTIEIRPATKEEVKWADGELKKCKKEMEK